MARHWSAYTAGVTEKQAMALDRMAKPHGYSNGQALLMDLANVSASKLSRMDRASLRPYLDEAFDRFNNPPAPEPESSPADVPIRFEPVSFSDPVSARDVETGREGVSLVAKDAAGQGLVLFMSPESARDLAVRLASQQD